MLGCLAQQRTSGGAREGLQKAEGEGAFFFSFVYSVVGGGDVFFFRQPADRDMVVDITYQVSRSFYVLVLLCERTFDEGGRQVLEVFGSMYAHRSTTWYAP